MKKVGIAIAVLFVIYLVLALVGPTEVKVERNISISSSADAVKPYLTNLKLFHDKWSPWTEKDPAAEVKYIGTAGEAGHLFSWNSKVEEVGTGTLELVCVTSDSVVQRLAFEGMGDSKAYYILKENEGKTEVTWGMQMKAPFFFRPMMMFMNMDKMIGPDYEKGLASLKKVVEETPASSGQAEFAIKEIEWPEVYYAGTKFETVKFNDLKNYFGNNLPAIFQALESQKVQPESAPSAIYNWYDEEKGETNLAAAVKVSKGTNLKGFEIHTFPACKVLHIEFFGNYEKIGDAHMAMDAYLKSQGLTNGPVFEEYVTDPMKEADTSKWLTNIYYTLK
ncbi:MAG: SRPBCC family protein [Sphingobacteriaceae bacterium]|nr:SRPBCC family protein [Sphingobacteriaceae bacterium]